MINNELMNNIKNELLAVSTTSNFLFGCVLEFASHVTVSWFSTFVFADNQTKSVFQNNLSLSLHSEKTTRELDFKFGPIEANSV